MLELKIARRYAQALFEIARDEQRLESVGNELALLAEGLGSTPGAVEFLSSAVTEEAQKQRLLESISERLGASELLRKFVALLVRRGRAALIPEIQKHFAQLQLQHLGVISAEVETARPLGDQARGRLEQALSRTTGKKVQLVEKVRPELIAGIKVQLGSLLIDGTLERQLQELNRAMLG